MNLLGFVCCCRSRCAVAAIAAVRAAATASAGACLLAPWPAAAIPLSVGASSEMQVGWQLQQRETLRTSRLQQQGTSGEFIRPSDGGNSFLLYGTPFEPVPGQESFDHGSILRDTTTVSESRSSTFSVLGVTSTTRQTTNPPPLGFDNGNGVYSFFSR